MILLLSIFSFSCASGAAYAPSFWRKALYFQNARFAPAQGFLFFLFLRFRLSLIWRSSPRTEGLSARLVIPSAVLPRCSEVGSDRGDFLSLPPRGLGHFPPSGWAYPSALSSSLSFSAFSGVVTSGSAGRSLSLWISPLRSR